jgi:hypothetical protein
MQLIFMYFSYMLQPSWTPLLVLMSFSQITFSLYKNFPHAKSCYLKIEVFFPSSIDALFFLYLSNLFQLEVLVKCWIEVVRVHFCLISISGASLQVFFFFLPVSMMFAVNFWSQGLMLARQVLYCLSLSASPFLC